jgi:hypothetical protein
MTGIERRSDPRLTEQAGLQEGNIASRHYLSLTTARLGGLAVR